MVEGEDDQAVNLMSAKIAIALAVVAAVCCTGCASARHFLTTGELQSGKSYQFEPRQVHSPDACEDCSTGGHSVPDYISIKHPVSSG